MFAASRFTRLVFLGCLFASSESFAMLNDCTHLGVQVQNRTGDVCTLISYQTKQGNLNHVTPNTHQLVPNASQTFQMAQTYSESPTVVLNYSCNGHHITLESHQNYCLFEAGNIRGQVISADPLIAASSTTHLGSYSNNYQGQIYWILQNP